MEVPSRVADEIFEKALARGVVLITEMRFSSGTRKLKYLVTLNKHPTDSTTLLFLTTSQTDYYDRFPHVDHIRIKPKMLPFFPKRGHPRLPRSLFNGTRGSQATASGSGAQICRLPPTRLHGPARSACGFIALYFNASQEDDIGLVVTTALNFAGRFQIWRKIQMEMWDGS